MYLRFIGILYTYIYRWLIFVYTENLNNWVRQRVQSDFRVLVNMTLNTLTSNEHETLRVMSLVYTEIQNKQDGSI